LTKIDEIQSYESFATTIPTNQSGAAEAWWTHNPQVPRWKPGSDKKETHFIFFKLTLTYFYQGLRFDSSSDNFSSPDFKWGPHKWW